MISYKEQLKANFDTYLEVVEAFITNAVDALIAVYQRVIDDDASSAEQRSAAADVVAHIRDNVKNKRSYLIYAELSRHSLAATGTVEYFDIAHDISDIYGLLHIDHVSSNVDGESVTEMLRGIYSFLSADHVSSNVDGKSVIEMQGDIAEVAMIYEQNRREIDTIAARLRERITTNNHLFPVNIFDDYQDVLDAITVLNDWLPIAEEDRVNFEYCIGNKTYRDAVFPANSNRFVSYLRKLNEYGGLLGDDELSKVLNTLVVRKYFFAKTERVRLDLSLFGQSVTDAVVEKIVKMLKGRLESLNLSGTAVTDAVFKSVARYAVNLKKMVLSEVAGITLALPKLVTLPNVEVMDITNCPNLNGFSFNLPRLRQLIIGDNLALQGAVDHFPNVHFIQGLRQFVVAREQAGVNANLKLVFPERSVGEYILGVIRGIYAEPNTSFHVSWHIGNLGYVLQHGESHILLELCKGYALSYDKNGREQFRFAWKYMVQADSGGDYHKVLLAIRILQQLSDSEKTHLLSNCFNYDQGAAFWRSVLAIYHNGDLSKDEFYALWQWIAGLDDEMLTDNFKPLMLACIDANLFFNEIADFITHFLASQITPEESSKCYNNGVELSKAILADCLQGPVYDIRDELTLPILDRCSPDRVDLRRSFFGMAVGRVSVKRQFACRFNSIFTNTIAFPDVDDLISICTKNENYTIVQAVCDEISRQDEDGDARHKCAMLRHYMQSSSDKVRVIGFDAFRKILDFGNSDVQEAVIELFDTLLTNENLSADLRNELVDELESLVLAEDKFRHEVGLAIMRHCFNQWGSSRSIVSDQLVVKWCKYGGNAYLKSTCN